MISFIFSIKPWIRKTIGFIYLLNIAWLSLSPSYNLPVIHIPYIDKVVHMCMYLGLAFLAGWIYDIGHHRVRFGYYIPVSYTHLDVYKRQTYARVRPGNPISNKECGFGRIFYCWRFPKE